MCTFPLVETKRPWYGIGKVVLCVGFFCGKGVVQNITYSYVWDVVAGKKIMIFLKPAHLAIIGQHWPTLPLSCPELDIIT